MFANYAALKTAFAVTTHRGDTANYVDTLQALAEDRIANDLRVQEMETIIDLTCSGEWTSFPADYLEAKRIGDEDPDENGYFDSYEIVGHSIRLTPVASASNQVDVELVYYQRQSALTQDADTHSALTANSNIYLAALMIEYAIFAEDDALLDKWVKHYTDGIEGANQRARNAKYPGGSLQVRSV